MASAIADDARFDRRCCVAIGTHAPATLSSTIEWHESSHPVPDARSVAAAERALQVASAVGGDECLLLLLSGGASALMALPAEGLTLDDKRHAVRTMMLAGADIQALNTVRKHLSRIKGGRLAAACRGTMLTLAVSDVIGDDLSVIGSGPGLADASTWSDAAAALEKFGGRRHAPAVRALVERGCAGEIPDSPKPGDATLTMARAAVIAARRNAVDGARRAAEQLGYRTIVIEEPICGEARHAATDWLARVRTAIAAGKSQPMCVLSGGETTVRVTGSGRGGRNQEFVLALVEPLARETEHRLIASIGTDGIDGPTDAAGALADRTTLARASAIGFTPQMFLDDNDSYDFFAMLGDLIHLGPTDTNVGDIQVMLSVP